MGAQPVRAARVTVQYDLAGLSTKYELNPLLLTHPCQPGSERSTTPLPILGSDGTGGYGQRTGLQEWFPPACFISSSELALPIIVSAVAAATPTRTTTPFIANQSQPSIFSNVGYRGQGELVSGPAWRP